MHFDSSLHSDRPVPALIGNGTLSTRIGRTGYHEPSEWPEGAASSQEFVLAGRRLPGPRRKLIPFGVLERSLWVGGESLRPVETSQAIHTDIAEVRTRTLYEGLLESTRTLVLGHRNIYFVETRISNHSADDHDVLFLLRYQFGCRNGIREKGLTVDASEESGRVEFSWETEENLGVTTVATDGMSWKLRGDEAVLESRRVLGPGEEMIIRTAITFSDRTDYQSPFDFSQGSRELNRHLEHWRKIWEESDVVTGDENVDRFRRIALYTIVSQATPWSIPPTLTERYWGGGAFHDEYYPFMGLISGGHIGLARNAPYYRLATLSRAISRARVQGALYAWSSTEDGEERDPHGHWYSERFHLGAIAATAWAYWLYTRRIEALEDLYPVIRECARYFECHMLERDERGNLRTRVCTDFDESVGEVAAGPFTMAAAAFCLDRAAEAARRLGVDRERRPKWDMLSRALKQNFVVDLEHRRYSIPDGKPIHSSIAGFVVPFFCDEGSEFARNSVSMLHIDAQTPLGWKPGFSDAFDGTTWLWTAGHLGMCHSVLSDGVSAWEAVRRGVMSCGQFMSPNEHLNPDGEPIVPWFTTGCGAWLAALHWMFARVDDNGDYLMPAVPETMSDFSFRGLRLSRGIAVAAKVRDGQLVYLAFRSETSMSFSFEMPAKFAKESWPSGVGKIDDLDSTWRIQIDLLPGTNTLIEELDLARKAASEL